MGTNNKKTDKFLSAFFIFFVIIIIHLLYNQICNGYTKNNWGLTDWMINYQGGIVRRGLPGEVIFQLYSLFNLSPYYTIVGISVISLLSLISFFLFQFIKKGFPIFILPFVFFLGNPIINNYWIKKDSFIILIFIIVIYLFFKLKKRILRFILVNLLLVIGILSHETIVFLVFPIILLAMLADCKRIDGHYSFKSLIRFFLFFIPSIIILLLPIYFHGNEFIAEIIWHSWKNSYFPYPASINEGSTYGSIGGLAWTTKYGIFYTLNTYHHSKIIDVYPLLSLFIVLFAIYYVLSNTNCLNNSILTIKPKTHNKTFISNILLFQLFISIFPLFIIGCDAGRWIFYWATSSYALICLIPDDKREGLFPHTINNFTHTINKFITSIIGQSKGVVILLSLFIGVNGVFTPFFYDTIKTSAIYILLDYISKIMKVILNFII